MRWPSRWRWSRLSSSRFAHPFREPDVRLLRLEPVEVEDQHPEARPHVLHEIGETVYAQKRHHWTQWLFAYLWFVAAVVSFVLILLGTPDTILGVALVVTLWAVWVVRRQHPVYVVAVRLAAAAAVLALIGAWREHLHIVPMVLMVGCLLRGGWLLALYHKDVFVVTDKRILRPQGVLFKDRAVMPLAHVLDITVVKPLLGRMLGYGHLVFESAAQVQGLREIRFMPDPDGLDRTIQLLLHGGPPPWGGPPPGGAVVGAHDGEGTAQAGPADEQTASYRWGAQD